MLQITEPSTCTLQHSHVIVFYVLAVLLQIVHDQLHHNHHKTAPSPIRTDVASRASSNGTISSSAQQQPSSPTSPTAAAAAAAASASKLPTAAANATAGQSLDMIMLATAKHSKAKVSRSVQMKYNTVAHTHILTMHMARVLSRFKAVLACVLVVSATLLDYTPKDRSAAAFLNNFDAIIDAGSVVDRTNWDTLVQQYASFYSTSAAWCRPLSLELDTGYHWQWNAQHYIRATSLVTHSSKHGTAEFDCTRARVYTALLSMALVTVVVLLLVICAFRCEIVLYETIMAPLDRVMTKLKACIANVDRATKSPNISTRINTGKKSNAVQKRNPSIRLSRDQLNFSTSRAQTNEALERMIAFDEYTRDTGTDILETDVMESAVDKCKYF
jgi:hypothetical protein